MDEPLGYETSSCYSYQAKALGSVTRITDSSGRKLLDLSLRRVWGDPSANRIEQHVRNTHHERKNPSPACITIAPDTTTPTAAKLSLQPRGAKNIE